MNLNMNEDVMWERLKDIQREGEIAGIDDGRTLAAMVDAGRRLVRRARLFAGQAVRRTPRAA